MTNQGEHPKSFFKYMTASTAEIVLKNRTLRWSHPSQFDDTLDVAQVCDEKMDINKQRQTQEAIIDLAANPATGYNKKTSKRFKCLSSLIFLCNITKTPAISELKKMPLFISKSVEELNKCWKNIRSDARILCLGVEPNNNRLWNDYADKHKGVAIELACRKESDSPWLVAKPVEYVEKRDLFITPKEWAEILILEASEAAKCIVEKCTLKNVSDYWSEQNEWRILSFRRDSEIGSVSDYGVNPNDFSAVYFGYEISSKDREKLLSLLKGELGHVAAYQCKLDDSQNMIFKKVK